MSEKDNILIAEIFKQLKKSGFDLVGIYFFGSRVKNTFNEDSDYDIAIILKEEVEWKVKEKIQSFIYDIMLQYDIIIDSHIYTEKEIEMSETPIRETIKSDGIYYAC